MFPTSIPPRCASDGRGIGKVRLGKNVSVWGGCVLRGDIDWITVGDDSNIQDGTIVHTSMGAPVTLGKGVTVGHKAMIHGALIDDYSLIGMSATLLDYSHVYPHCLIGAGALVKEKGVIPEGHLAIGVPAKPTRPLTPAEIQMIHDRAANYVRYAHAYKQSLMESSQEK
jgi:carbonic anhydrase/acetyltransferase-like protein (isoleucine patch superfamily)